MKLVIAATAAFVLALVLDQVVTLVLAATSAHPAIPHWLDQRYLILADWGFPVFAVWGFNARWLPVFLGIREPSSRGLTAALATSGGGLVAALLGYLQIATALLLVAGISPASPWASLVDQGSPPRRSGSPRRFQLSFAALTSDFWQLPDSACTRHFRMFTVAFGAHLATR